MKGPWLFEGEEQFPTLGGIQQRVQIGEFEEFGRGLVIDGATQLAETIDAAYTIALVFPAALLADSRRRWLILGGGDGAAAREALRFRDTESVQLVDISRLVIDATQQLIPSFRAGCQHDHRLDIFTCDAWEILRGMAARRELADVMIFDLTDPEDAAYTPFSESSADHLYTEDSFRLAAQCLTPGGVFVAQVQELSLLRCEGHRRHRETLKKIFRHVYSYRTYIEFFGYWQSFVIASNHDGPWSPARAQPVQDQLAQLYDGVWAETYSAAWHEQLFALPPSLVNRLG
jgi:spermidine synthase